MTNVLVFLPENSFDICVYSRLILLVKNGANKDQEKAVLKYLLWSPKSDFTNR